MKMVNPGDLCSSVRHLHYYDIGSSIPLCLGSSSDRLVYLGRTAETDFSPFAVVFSVELCRVVEAQERFLTRVNSQSETV